MKLLDLYCGAGGAAMGYFRAGFTEIVGVDIQPQLRYPFSFIQGDALNPAVDISRFDFIHASPPCQKHTALKTVWNYRDNHTDLIPQTREMLKATGKPYVIENVPGAPLLNPFKLCGSAFGLGVEVYDGWRDLQRHRLFESNVNLLSPPCNHHANGTIGIYGDHARDRRRKPGVRDRGIDFPDSDKLALGKAAMQMPWVGKWRELSEAIPPAYTEWIGKHLLTLI